METLAAMHGALAIAGFNVMVFGIIALLLVRGERQGRDHGSRGDTASPLFKALFDSSPDATLACNREWRIVVANGAAERMFGYAPGDLNGLPLDDIIPPDQTLDATGEDSILCGLRRDRSTFPLQFSIGEVANAGGTFFIITARDVTERKRFELALRESEERYRDLFDNSTDLIHSVAADGTIEYANRRWLELLGYGQSDLALLNVGDILHPDCRTDDLPKLLGSDVDWLETRFVTRDGRAIVVEGRTTTRVEEGRVSSTRGVFRDVTAHRRAEHALEGMRRKNELILHAAGNGIYGCDAAGKTTFVNPAAADMLLMTEMDFFLSDCDDVFRTRDESGRLVPAVRSDIRLTIATGQTIARDDRFFARRDGTWFPANYVVSPMTDGGVVTGAVLTFTDITSWREAEATRAASERRLQSLLDNMLGGLVTANGRGVITYVNPGAEAIFGYTREQIVGRTLDCLLASPPGRLQPFLATIGSKALGRVTEWTGRRANGETFPFELALFQFESGGKTAYAGSVRDISERKQVEMLKQQFVATVSHELRTPLASVRGSLALVGAGIVGELPPEAAEMIAVADRNAMRLEHLINDILDYERMSRGHSELVIEPAPLQEIFDRAADVVETHARAAHVRVLFEATSARVAADSRRLVQVLVNLAANAVKFSPAGSTIDVSAVATGSEVTVRVRDRGRGIPPDYVEKIFEPFQQVEAADSRSKGGAGLGLTISRSIVEQHGGTIGVVSVAGEGSTFWFRIPAAPPAEGTNIERRVS